MIRTTLITAAVAMALGATGSAWAAGYKAGTYQASAQGMGGPVKVEVEFTSSAIKAVRIVGTTKETPGIGTTALEKLPPLIVENQSLGIDAITGASKSSSAVLTAVADCVRQAGGDPKALMAVPVKKSGKAASKTIETDLAIVGAGGAGQVATLRASSLGKKVVLIEKMPFVGGAAAINGGTVVIQGSKIQKELGVKDDTPEIMRQDLLKNGHNLNDRSKLDLYVNHVGPTIDWLLDQGLVLDTKAGFTNEAEYSKPRCIRWLGGAPANMKRMHELVQKTNAQVFTGTRAEELIVENGAVVGVKAVSNDGTTYTIKSKAVLLSTGGFGYAKDMLTGALKQSLYYGPVSSTGDGHKMAKAVGAKLQLMEYGKIYPNGVEVAPGIAKSTIWANKNAFEKGSGILVAKNGKRVISETASNNAIKQVELKQPDSTLYILMDKPTYDGFVQGLYIGGITGGEVDSWIAKDGKGTPKFVKADTIEAAAAKIGIDGKALKQEVVRYNSFVKAGKDADFDRPAKFMTRAVVEHGPYFIIEQQPRFATTMGGVVTNDSFNVLDTNGKPIKGLFAAGEIVGGAMGDDSPPGGNIGWAVTSGKLAAEGAVNSMK